MQLPIYSDMQFRSPGISEDCLTLNVWAPPQGTAKLPVLLYFYGGGFQAGDASEFRYDGEHLARRGIVVVTANYRLGVFGFFAHPGLTAESPHHASGNYGLLDEVAALQWVHDNIAAFGGDPGRITIGGESAGSISVTALMVSPLSRTLIAGAIGESGGLIKPTFPPVPLDSAEQAGLRFARDVGDSSIAGLRAIPAATLLDRSGGHGFRVTRDGWFLTELPESTLAAGRQAPVPLLVGWNAKESGWQGILGDSAPTPERYAAAVTRLYGADAGDVLRAFPGSDSGQVKASGTLLASARFTALSTWKWARLAGRTGHHPVYVYLYARSRGDNGAVHSAEIEYALGNLGTNHVYRWTADDSTVSETMQEYFAAFIKTGRPEVAGLPAWPPNNTASMPVMTLDVHPNAATPAFAGAFAFLDSLYIRSRP
jgi:para-nitrobenzyl esterase